ncbi:MAG: hypothetical protein QW341_03190 [Candidatus Bathyarchaeia archaeon]
MLNEFNEYITLKLEAGEAFLRKDIIESMKSIDAIIFDCDGVLIDIRGSYDKTISKSVALIFEGLTGLKIPEDFVSDEIIFLFRRSGGFNNDWDIVYGSLMFLLSSLPEKVRGELAELMARLMHLKGAARRFLAIKEEVGESAFNVSCAELEKLRENLKGFTMTLDEAGVISVDRAILSSGAVRKSFYSLLKMFIESSGRVGESIIATVFEEIFCGPDLFKEIYGIKPEIFFGRGMICNGKPIISWETLEHLSSIVGKSKLGVASGSRFKSARYVLQGILDYFNPEAQVFLDDVESIEEEYSKRGFLKVNFKKPNPYSLFKSSWSLEPFRLALFIGDSIEDAMAVKKAKMLDSRFIFAGVYKYTNLGEEAKREFLNFKCDIILPSVNEVPYVIERIKGGKI